MWQDTQTYGCFSIRRIAQKNVTFRGKAVEEHRCSYKGGYTMRREQRFDSATSDIGRKRAMAQAASRRPLTSEALVHTRVSPCGICGGQSKTETGFFPELFDFILLISFHRGSPLIYPLSLSLIVLNR
jgi:hypothetical protein